MEQLQIRPAVKQDVSAFARLQPQWAEEAVTFGFGPADEQAIRSALGPYLLVAEVEGQVVGLLAGSVHISAGTAVIPAGASYGEIDDLYVAPAFRQGGIGGQTVGTGQARR